MMLKRLWDKATTLGIEMNLTSQEQKQVYILNAFALTFSLIYIGYVFVALLTELWEILPVKLVGLIIFIIPLWMNHLKNYVGGRWFFCITSTLFFTFSSIAFGSHSGLHYALLLVGALPLFFFQDKKIIFPLFLFSLLAFIGSEAFHQFYDAIWALNHVSFRYANLVVIFLCFFFFVYLFLSGYHDAERKLLGYTNELEAKNRVLNEAKSELQGTCQDLVEAETQLRSINVELKNAKKELERVLKSERDKHQKLQSRDAELTEANKSLVASEEEMRQYLEEILQINQNLEHTKDHLENFFTKNNQDKERFQWVNEQLKKAQTQLVQAEKMSSLGQLTAGIAHEINNPINFVSAGVEVMSEMMKDIRELLALYLELEDIDNEEERKQFIEGIASFKQEIQFEELVEEMDTTLQDIIIGTKRTADIVKGLRNFSRTDEQEARFANIHESIDSTFVILNTKLRGRIGVVKMYDQNMPLIECFPGQLNQVFMNLISNAIQAIEGEGEISITTQVFDREIEVVISDNGSGMDEITQTKIFEPFFTTKEVGEGTGLGLSITYGIIEKHKGSIEVNSTLNVGTQFTIRLPKRL